MKEQTIFIQTLFIFFILSIGINTNSSARQTVAVTNDFRMEVLIPLYQYPYEYHEETSPGANDDYDEYLWNWIHDAQKKVNVTTVINPYDGPRPIVDSNENGKKDANENTIQHDAIQAYNEAILKIRTDGVATYGYIKTGWMGDASNSDHSYYGMPATQIYDSIVAHLEFYRDYYHSSSTSYTSAYLDGIFLDEAEPNQADEYKKIYDFVQSMNLGWKIILNPGKADGVSKLEPYGDIILTYETPETNLNTQATHSGNPYKYSTVVYNVNPNLTNVKNIVANTWNKHYGYVYLTDDTDSDDNPYDQSPTFWDEFINYIYILNRGRDTRPVYENNYKLPGTVLPIKATEITCNSNSTVIISNNSSDGGYEIYHCYLSNPETWNQFPGAATAISTPGNTLPWVVNSYGNVFFLKRSGNNYWWQSLPSIPAKEIAVSPTSRGPFILAKNENTSSSEPSGRAVYEYKNNVFEKRSGGGKKIAMGKDGKVWLIDNAGKVFSSSDKGNSWTRVSNMSGAKDICVSHKGNNTYIIDSSNNVKVWSNNKWLKVIENVTKFSVDGNEMLWVVKTNGNFYKVRIY